MKLTKWWLAFLAAAGLILVACVGLVLVTGAALVAARTGSLPATVLSSVERVAPANISLAAPAQAATPSVAQAANLGNVSDLQATLEALYTQVNPSVVNIQVTTGGASSFGGQGSGSALGSGFIWDTQGHIVTNNHVIDGASDISVTFADGSSVTAKLVGADPYADLAVLKVDVAADKLHPVTVGDSTQVKVGQLAIAIGNPFGLQGTMTQGIISALSRSLPVDQTVPGSDGTGRYSIPDIIQTDAPINPGNSGGVLVDTQGHLIGVTAAIASSVQANSGVGFVIPAAIVQKVVPVLIDKGVYQHPYLGISGATLTPELAQAAGLPVDLQGVLVVSVTSSGPAQKAGLKGGSQSSQQSVGQGGDVITAINGQPVKSFEDLVSYLFNQTESGQTVQLTVLRQGKQQTINLTLGALAPSGTGQ